MVSFRRHARNWGAYLACGGLVLGAQLIRRSKEEGSEPNADSTEAESATLEAIAGALHRAEKRYLSKHKHDETPSGLAQKVKTAVGRITTSEWLMVLFTAVIAVVGIASAIISHGQLVEMRNTQTSGDTSSAAQIAVMNSQVAALQGQLDEIRKQRELTILTSQARMQRHEMVMQPYTITGKPANVGDTDIVGWHINREYTNEGGTDARYVNSTFNITAVKMEKYFGAWSCPNDPVSFPENAGRTIHPQAGFTEMWKNIRAADLQKILHKEYVLLIYGYIQYRDIFPDSVLHHERWCENLVVNDAEATQFSFLDLITSDVQ